MSSLLSRAFLAVIAFFAVWIVGVAPASANSSPSKVYYQSSSSISHYTDITDDDLSYTQIFPAHSYSGTSTVTLPSPVKIESRTVNTLSVMVDARVQDPGIYFFSPLNSTDFNTANNGGVYMAQRGDNVIFQWNVNHNVDDEQNYTTSFQIVFSTVNNSVRYRYDPFSAGVNATFGSATFFTSTQGLVGSGNGFSAYRGTEVAFQTIALDPIASSTNDQTPTISAHVDATGTGAVLALTRFNGDGEDEVYTDFIIPGASGYVTDHTEELADGTYVVRLSQDGNQVSQTFVIDTVAPVLTTISPETVTNDNTPTLSGMSDNAAPVNYKLYRDSVNPHNLISYNTLEPGFLNSFSTSLEDAFNEAGGILIDGNYVVVLTQSDAADNQTVVTKAFRVDTVGPAVTLSAPASVTNDSTPTISGIAGVSAGDNGTVAISLVKINGETTIPVGEFTPSVHDNGSFAVTPEEPLSDGVYEVAAVQTDSVENSAGEATRRFTVDTVAPLPLLTAPNAQSASEETKPAFQGTAGRLSGDLTDLHVEVLQGDTLVQTLNTVDSGNGFTVSPTTTLAPGSYTARVVQLDVAGNRGVSAAVPFTVSVPSSNLLVTGTLGTSELTVGDSTPLNLTVANLRAVAKDVVLTLTVADGVAITGIIKDGSAVTLNDKGELALGEFPNEFSSNIVVTVKGVTAGEQPITATVKSSTVDTDDTDNSVTIKARVVPAVVNQPADEGDRPVVTATNGDSVSQTAVQINGTVNPLRLKTEYYFEYGLKKDKLTKKSPVLTTSGVVAASFVVSGLVPRDHVFYRLVATNAKGTSTSNVEDIATKGRSEIIRGSIKASPVFRKKGTGYILRTSGRITVNRVPCDGTVTTSLVIRGATIKRKVDLTSKCTFKLDIPVTREDALQAEKTGAVLSAEFSGNDFLQPQELSSQKLKKLRIRE
jgi:hypothetical protein